MLRHSWFLLGFCKNQTNREFAIYCGLCLLPNEVQQYIQTCSKQHQKSVLGYAHANCIALSTYVYRLATTLDIRLGIMPNMSAIV